MTRCATTICFACWLLVYVSGVQEPPRFALYKTHKTASTTLGSVLFRFAARKGIVLWSQGNSSAACLGGWTPGCRSARVLDPLPDHTRRVQAVLHHVTVAGELRVAFSEVMEWYKKVIDTDFVLIVPIREPVVRYISWYNFYIKHNNCTFLDYPCKAEWDSLDTWAGLGHGANGFSKEFGITSASESENLVDSLESMNAFIFPDF